MKIFNQFLPAELISFFKFWLRSGWCGGERRFGANPNFSSFEVLYLINYAKNSGWQIALISFVTFLHQGRKVSSKKVERLFETQLFNNNNIHIQ